MHIVPRILVNPLRVPFILKGSHLLKFSFVLVSPHREFLRVGLHRVFFVSICPHRDPSIVRVGPRSVSSCI